MNRAAALLLVMLAALPMAAKTSINHALTIARGETLKEGITAIRANVRILGCVDESIFQIGGTLLIEGEVTGDVITLGCAVELGPQARIRKDLYVFVGTLAQQPGSQIGGETLQIKKRDDLKQMAQTLLPFLPDNGGAGFFRIFMIPMWFIIALIVLAIAGTSVSKAEELLLQSTLKTGIIGLIGLIVFLFLFAVFFVTSIFVIGIPFLLFTFLLYFLVLIFGHTVVFYTMGHQLWRLFKVRQGGAVLFLLTGVGLYAVCKFIPYLGFAALVVVNIYVLGIAIGYFGRKKLFSTRAGA
jgi:hypothetical protein